ncbi:hypothetical protein SCHPADRAFT_902750 [Schizopora paradoxa]|uniref:Uncharacterized protein n=1 Tax=Schizopora paradoxa TaxID=27342 RepID=A0A0H2SDJ3_9AGAM|nr:hypothetical protein SCHPADRAFT_902750 [Schizopora paradoxa]
MRYYGDFSGVMRLQEKHECVDCSPSAPQSSSEFQSLTGVLSGVYKAKIPRTSLASSRKTVPNGKFTKINITISGLPAPGLRRVLPPTASDFRDELTANLNAEDWVR